MIREDQTFLGISMKTRRHRRMVVLGHALFLLALGVVAVLYPRGMLPAMAVQCLTLGGMLGGIQSQGPVKRYERSSRLSDDFSATTSSFPVQTLNLDGHLPLGNGAALDEREHAERDRAHYEAYRILRLVVPIFGLAVMYAFWGFPVKVGHALPGLLWLLILFVLSLPQSVLLWTAPDGAGDGPQLLPGHAT